MYRSLGQSLGGACRSTCLMADRMPIQQVRGCKVLLQLKTKLTIAPVTSPSSYFHTGMSRLNEVEDTSKEEKIIDSKPKNFVQALYNKVFTGLPKAKLKACGYMLETHCSQARRSNLNPLIQMLYNSRIILYCRESM